MAVFRRVYPDDTLGRHGWFVMGHPFDPPSPMDWKPNHYGDSWRQRFFDPTLDKGHREV